ncbi:MAG: sigma-70 family RNA polymerase sigma factor [Solirubrobacteraceae bacterium]|nr:sigma-70 family RNA polymerase sigma factor [Solirubrobacteraceae bacterium]
MTGRRHRPERTERKLAARLRKRDPAVMDEIYARYGRITYGYLVRVLGDPAAAEDVQQQVFLEVWQRGPAYDPALASPSTWIMTIARSRAIDHLRKRVPEPRDPAGSLATFEDAETPIDDLHEEWRLAAMLAELPPEEADVLRMRFQLNLSQSEIAERTGIKMGTVKTRMARGLNRLRDELGEEAR